MQTLIARRVIIGSLMKSPIKSKIRMSSRVIELVTTLLCIGIKAENTRGTLLYWKIS